MSITISDAIKHAGLKISHLDDANLIIYSILSKVINLPQEYLWAHPDKIITQQQFDQFEQMINRAVNHEPLAYIIGDKEFYGIPFFVTQDTLIPRPESEKIIEISRDFLAAHYNPLQSKPVIVDVGTGSGCIAITLALLHPHAIVYAIDISSSALNVAKRNANRHNITNVIFLDGSLLEPLQAVIVNSKVDLIVANLPYISDIEFPQLPANIRQFEPELALRSGNDPDVLNRQLIEQAQKWLKPQGKLIYETTNGHIVEVNPTS